MLIVFDLDDTLVDTSLSVTPNVLKRAFFKAIKEGLQVRNIKEDLRLLFKINNNSLSTEEALKIFLIKKNGIKFFEIVKKELFTLDDKINILPIKDSLEVLEKLSQFYKLALVTLGDKEFQMKKMKKAGINTSFFTIIDVIKDDKMVSYKKLLNMYKEKIFVCGDRIDRDLKPAKLLNMGTIHFANGRGEEQFDEKIVDYRIKDLKEIFKIIEEDKNDYK